MGEVIALPQSPLRPYLGLWRIDPLSVGRRKKASSPLNDPGFARLWACSSWAEQKALLDADPALAERYRARNAWNDRTLEVTAAHLIFRSSANGAPREEACPIVKTTSEGRSAIAQVVTRNQLTGYAFRRQKSWILVSERYYGRAATLYPRSPVFRYYKDLAE